MNGKDLLDIMELVDDDLIAKAEVLPEGSSDLSERPDTSIKPVRNNVTRKVVFKRIWTGIGIGIAAATIAVIGFALWKTGGLENEPAGSTRPTGVEVSTGMTGAEVTTLPTETEITTLPTESTWDSSGITEFTEAPGKVLFAPDKNASLLPIEIEGALPGDVLLPVALKEEIEKPENQEKYFAVRIMVCHIRCVAEYVATHESSKDLSEERIIELFDKEIREEIEEEMHRLESAGIYLTRVPNSPSDELEDYHIYNGFTVEGYLTGKELSEFTGDPSRGYRFSWLVEGEETINPPD
jgi:hypothetical protein